MPSSTPQDLHIATPHGRLFAQRWSGGADAVPIVLLHDSLGCVELWRDFPATLAAATAGDVVAYDRLGFGRSDPHPGRLDAGFIAAEAGAGFAHVREAFALERFVVFGHSVGGGMAVGCAARYPAQCRALVTESAQAFVEDRTRDGIRAARAAFAEPGQVERLSKYHGDKAAWVLSTWIDTWLAPAFADWSLDADLAEVTCPTLALHGERDEYGSARHPERIAAGVRGPATLRVLPGCGHVPHRERARETLELIAAWLAAVD